MQNLLSRIEYHHFYVQRCCGERCCPTYTQEINDIKRMYGGTTYANSATQYMASTGSRPRKYSNSLNKSIRGRKVKLSRGNASYKRIREGGQVGLWTTPRATEIMANDVMLDNLAVQTQAGMTANSFVLLNGITAGSAFYERRGRKIGMDTLRIDVAIQPLPNAAATIVYPPFKGRLIVFYDRQSNGVIPAVPNLLLDVNSANAGGTTTVWSNPNLN